jgi:hypothetical protein
VCYNGENPGGDHYVQRASHARQFHVFSADVGECSHKPREETYAAMPPRSQAKSMTAYLWVFLASIVSSSLTLIVQGSAIRSQLDEAGVGGQLGGGVGAIVVTLLCGTPIAL